MGRGKAGGREGGRGGGREGGREGEGIDWTDWTGREYWWVGERREGGREGGRERGRERGREKGQTGQVDSTGG